VSFRQTEGAAAGMRSIVEGLFHAQRNGRMQQTRTNCWDQWNPTSGVRDARREANGSRRSARRAASVIGHLRRAAAAELWLRWMDGGGHGVGKGLDSNLSK
jgi:hypothetical protein